MKKSDIYTDKTVNAILGEDHTIEGVVYKKGTKVNAYDLKLEGAIYCLGTGWYEFIPLDKFTKYVETTETTTTTRVGNTETKKRNKVTKNVTNEWVTMWKREQEKKFMAEVNEKVRCLNIHIKNTSKMISDVKSGRSARKLKKFENDLNEIAVAYGIK